MPTMRLGGCVRRMSWVVCLLMSALVLSPAPVLLDRVAEAAVSKGAKQQLETAETNQGGGTFSSSRFKQQATVGSPIAGGRLSSARFRVIPGFIGATLSTPTTTPSSDLDLHVLYAKTDPLGIQIAPSSWQKDNDPIFFWEPPETGAEVAGYSYAIDSAPDEVVDSTGTSFDVSTSPLSTLPDGKHTFSVKAVNSAGSAGSPISFEIWTDRTPPHIVSYAPSPGAMLSTTVGSLSATISDGGSGVNKNTVTLLMNGAPAGVKFDPATGTMTAGDGAWEEGVNSLELRVSDAVGNALTPLVWSVTMDTKPPTGSVVINGGAAVTSSIYVTLGLSSTDATSGISRVLISNEELAGYVEEPYVSLRELWKLNAVRGAQRVYVRFKDRAGNLSAPVSDDIDLALLSPETAITSGPAGYSPDPNATFEFMCPEGGCVFSYAFDNGEWSTWSSAATATVSGLALGNHYFRVKAAKEVNGADGVQEDEEDPSPAERTWVVGVEPPIYAIPKGPPIKVWRLE